MACLCIATSLAPSPSRIAAQSRPARATEHRPRAAVIRSTSGFLAGRSFSGHNNRRVRMNSSSDGKDAPSETMSPEEALQLLEVSADASFDAIVAAKDAKLAEGVPGSKVDAAYDALLVQSMRKRLSGEVDTRIRFADVPKYKPPPKKESPLANINLPGGLAVENMPQDKSLTLAASFGVFASWALIQGVTDSPSAALTDVAGLQLGLSFAASIYFLREYKRLSIGRAVAITGGGLVLGALLGGLVQGWLRVDIVPLGSFGSPGVLVSEFSILSIWAACTFLA